MTMLQGRKWDIGRWLRLGVGIWIITQGVSSNNGLLIAMGAVFTLMPLLNVGCCGSGSCAVPQRKSIHDVEDVRFEEIRTDAPSKR